MDLPLHFSWTLAAPSHLPEPRGQQLQVCHIFRCEGMVVHNNKWSCYPFAV
jgi:hypothetical protein